MHHGRRRFQARPRLQRQTHHAAPLRAMKCELIICPQLMHYQAPKHTVGERARSALTWRAAPHAPPALSRASPCRPAAAMSRPRTRWCATCSSSLTASQVWHLFLLAARPSADAPAPAQRARCAAPLWAPPPRCEAPSARARSGPWLKWCSWRQSPRRTAPAASPAAYRFRALACSSPLAPVRASTSAPGLLRRFRLRERARAFQQPAPPPAWRAPRACTPTCRSTWSAAPQMQLH